MKLSLNNINKALMSADSDVFSVPEVFREAAFTQISLADVCPAGSSNNELRVLTDFLQTATTKRVYL